MKNMFFVAAALLSLPVLAETLKDRIHSVVESASGSHIVRFEKGKVGFVSTPEILEAMKQNTGAEVEVDLDRDHEIRLMNVVTPAPATYNVYLKNDLSQDPPAFEPTPVTMEKVNQIFNAMNPNFKRLSECSDRAHVWAWDEFQKSQIRSQKAFILFTASYINRVRFKWWFHVAPMFTLENGQKIIADKMYKDRAVPLKEWTNMMVFSLRDCKMTTKFSEYDVNPQTEDCYMIFESMYYRLPGDVHEQELSGTYRSSWYESEVNGARARAFNVGRIQ